MGGMKTQRKSLLRAVLLLTVAACLVCASCGSSPNMYKHKRNTDCGC